MNFHNFDKAAELVAEIKQLNATRDQLMTETLNVAIRSQSGEVIVLTGLWPDTIHPDCAAGRHFVSAVLGRITERLKECHTKLYPL